jgi:hypothetical protein
MQQSQLYRPSPVIPDLDPPQSQPPPPSPLFERTYQEMLDNAHKEHQDSLRSTMNSYQQTIESIYNAHQVKAALKTKSVVPSSPPVQQARQEPMDGVQMAEEESEKTVNAAQLAILSSQPSSLSSPPRSSRSSPSPPPPVELAHYEAMGGV